MGVGDSFPYHILLQSNRLISLSDIRSDIIEINSTMTPTSNSTTVAVVLIDFQNEFAKQGGRLYHDVSGIMEENNVLENVQQVVAAAR